MKHLQREKQIDSHTDTLPPEPDAFLAALIALEHGDLSLARQYCTLAINTQAINRHTLARTLIGGAYTHLGRAALLANEGGRSLSLLERAVHFGTVGTESRVLDLMIAEAERPMRFGCKSPRNNHSSFAFCIHRGARFITPAITSSVPPTPMATGT